MIPLFVYGSLKRGFRHHGLLRRAVPLGGAAVPGCRLLLLQAYPALVRYDAGWVRGELYRIDRPLLAELDAFEDCPHLYRRELVRLIDGTWAYAYFASARSAMGRPVLPGECWIE